MQVRSVIRHLWLLPRAVSTLFFNNDPSSGIVCAFSVMMCAVIAQDATLSSDQSPKALLAAVPVLRQAFGQWSDASKA